MVTTAICIPVYEQWNLVHTHLLPKLVELKDELGEHYQIDILLIDNGSQHIPWEVEHPSTKQCYNLFICNKKGSYAARNSALNHTDVDLIIFTDADCLPEKNWLIALIEEYESSDRRTLLAGDVVITSYSETPSTTELYDISSGLPQKRYVSQGYAVTANLAIPRIVFDTVGVFDDTRFSGGDADFCQRALKAGFGLKFIPKAIVYHPARKTWEEYATKVRRMKGGQIRAGKLSRRLKYFFITLIPPVWRIRRTVKSDKLTFSQKWSVAWFQFRLWGVELSEMVCLLLGKAPERR